MASIQRNDYSQELRLAVSHLGHDTYYFQDNLLRGDDIFLSSYPRSGNHFVSYIIISAIHYTNFGYFPPDCSALGKAIPGIHSCNLSTADTAPRIIKTHYPYDPRYQRVIHVIRDPRDIIVSYYHYTRDTPQLFFTSLEGARNIQDFVDLFLAGMVWPCDLRFHSNSFSSRKSDIDYLPIYYEGLVNDPRTETIKLLDYLEIELNSGAINALIAHTSFENMARLRDSSVRFQRNMIRKGVVGGYMNELDLALIEKINSAFKDYLEIYGY